MVGPTKSPQTSLGLHQRVDSVLKRLRLVRKRKRGKRYLQVAGSRHSERPYLSFRETHSHRTKGGGSQRRPLKGKKGGRAIDRHLKK